MKKAYFFGIKTNKLMKWLINYNGRLYYASEERLLQTGRQVIKGT